MRSIIFTLIFLGVSATASAMPADFPPFGDVPLSHPNAKAIGYLKERDMIHGYIDGTFLPNQHINRAEFIKIITLALYEQTMVDQCGTHYFDDVPQGSWYWRFVCRARDGWLITGYPDGSFRPDTEINFVEAAKILANGFGLIQRDSHCNGKLCPEVDTIAHPWYEQYGRALSDRNSIPLSIMSLDQKITRGEMAEMIYRLKEGVTTKPSNTLESLRESHTTANHIRVPFSSSFFNLSFRVPFGFDVKEDQNFIRIAQSPFSIQNVGWGDNAFFRLNRYNDVETRKSLMEYYKTQLLNRKESTIMIDGSSFSTLQGDDAGRFMTVGNSVGQSAGKVFVVFFDASWLEIIERPANVDQNFAPIALGEQILMTFRFSR